MNVIYKIIFIDRLKSNIKPYYYIGSKTNCSIINGKIIDSVGNEYYGSSKYKNYKEITKIEKIEINILFQSDDISYKDLLLLEKEYHILNDVVTSTEYFNLNIATINNYSDPEYGTYKHIETNKYVRLKRDHPLVLNGTYVGATKNSKHTKETLNKMSVSNSGDKNGFYGKTHSDETKDKIRLKVSGKKHSEESKRKMSASGKGKPKSEEHKSKLGRKGYIMLKNINTSESIRILKEDKDKYDSNIWMNPYKIKCIQEKYIRGTPTLETKSKIGRKGYIVLKNIETLEIIRILKEDKDKYNSNIWMNPRKANKILKGEK